MNKLDAAQGRHSSSSNFLLTNASMLGVIVGAWLVVYIPGLFHPSLLDDADSVHAEASREILLNHDWVTLYVDGIRYLAKAPLMYWVVAITYKLFGISEWQTRLPLALSVLILAWCVYIFGRRFFGKEAGFYAALITVTSPGFYVFTRFLIPEVIVAIFLTLGLYFFLIACEQPEPSRWLCWGIAVTVALNILTKSLIGLAFPVGIMLAYLFLTATSRKSGSFILYRALSCSSPSLSRGTLSPQSGIPRNPQARKKASCGPTLSTNNSCASSTSAFLTTTAKSHCCSFTACFSSGCFLGVHSFSQP